MRTAYLCSRYPYISHTFVLREVEALRTLGADITTFSVRRTSREHLLAVADRQAAATTYALLPARPVHLLGAAGRAIATRPRRTFAALARAVRLAPSGVRGLLWQLFYLGEALILWDRCRLAGIRHIHSHFANNAADIALLAAVLGGSDWRWSFTMHGSTELADVGRHRLQKKVELAQFVVCTSDFGRSQLMRLVGPEHWKKLHTIHCAVDPERFRVAPRERAPDAPLQVMTVARLTASKGILLLIEAVARLVADGVDAQLTILGDGPEREAIASRARALGLDDRVILAGFVGQDEILDWYASADVFCLPSFAEGIPVVLMEAMAAELPVISTRIMGIPELVEHEVNGLLVTPTRVDELVGALARLAADPEDRRRMGAEGRKTIESSFASGVVALELHALIEGLGASATASEPAREPTPAGERG